MGEAQERYWQAVKIDLDDSKSERLFDSESPRTDSLELLGRQVERQAVLLRLCQVARDEAFREIYDPPRPGFAKRNDEFTKMWPKQVLSHEKFLRYLIDQMGLMRIWGLRFGAEDNHTP
jgi:hypothetical protein